ncbi:hypothetical protein BESB_040190 [Besnoitia besnoiti]|uniref:Mechanosensitive ion channel MscS domain-containing protein n=1 Tax=Besnoitia besnoiti TaxID=94643 RepID=A0A2A9MMC4_BESBE|nr:hypothetical protein BESB_040190 [Besnoitia besnoiti]PFH37561.1 hypothetical protein BESB_040190 [Besnoitia besnoiti]
MWPPRGIGTDQQSVRTAKLSGVSSVRRDDAFLPFAALEERRSRGSPSERFPWSRGRRSSPLLSSADGRRRDADVRSQLGGNNKSFVGSTVAALPWGRGYQQGSGAPESGGFRAFPSRWRHPFSSHGGGGGHSAATSSLAGDRGVGGNSMMNASSCADMEVPRAMSRTFSQQGSSYLYGPAGPRGAADGDAAPGLRAFDLVSKASPSKMIEERPQDDEREEPDSDDEERDQSECLRLCRKWLRAVFPDSYPLLWFLIQASVCFVLLLVGLGDGSNSSRSDYALGKLDFHWMPGEDVTDKARPKPHIIGDIDSERLLLNGSLVFICVTLLNLAFWLCTMAVRVVVITGLLNLICYERPAATAFASTVDPEIFYVAWSVFIYAFWRGHTRSSPLVLVPNSQEKTEIEPLTFYRLFGDECFFTADMLRAINLTNVVYLVLSVRRALLALMLFFFELGFLMNMNSQLVNYLTKYARIRKLNVKWSRSTPQDWHRSTESAASVCSSNEDGQRNLLSQEARPDDDTLRVTTTAQSSLGPLPSFLPLRDVSAKDLLNLQPENPFLPPLSSSSASAASSAASSASAFASPPSARAFASASPSEAVRTPRGPGLERQQLERQREERQREERSNRRAMEDAGAPNVGDRPTAAACLEGDSAPSRPGAAASSLHAPSQGSREPAQTSPAAHACRGSGERLCEGETEVERERVEQGESEDVVPRKPDEEAEAPRASVREGRALRDAEDWGGEREDDSRSAAPSAREAAEGRMRESALFILPPEDEEEEDVNEGTQAWATRARRGYDRQTQIMRLRDKARKFFRDCWRRIERFQQQYARTRYSGTSLRSPPSSRRNSGFPGLHLGPLFFPSKRGAAALLERGPITFGSPHPSPRLDDLLGDALERADGDREAEREHECRGLGGGNPAAAGDSGRPAARGALLPLHAHQHRPMSAFRIRHSITKKRIEQEVHGQGLPRPLKAQSIEATKTSKVQNWLSIQYALHHPPALFIHGRRIALTNKKITGTIAELLFNQLVKENRQPPGSSCSPSLVSELNHVSYPTDSQAFDSAKPESAAAEPTNSAQATTEDARRSTAKPTLAPPAEHMGLARRTTSTQTLAHEGSDRAGEVSDAALLRPTRGSSDCKRGGAGEPDVGSASSRGASVSSAGDLGRPEKTRLCACREGSRCATGDSEDAAACGRSERRNRRGAQTEPGGIDVRSRGGQDADCAGWDKPPRETAPALASSQVKLRGDPQSSARSQGAGVESAALRSSSERVGAGNGGHVPGAGAPCKGTAEGGGRIGKRTSGSEEPDGRRGDAMCTATTKPKAASVDASSPPAFAVRSSSTSVPSAARHSLHAAAEPRGPRGGSVGLAGGPEGAEPLGAAWEDEEGCASSGDDVQPSFASAPSLAAERPPHAKSELCAAGGVEEAAVASRVGKRSVALEGWARARREANEGVRKRHREGEGAADAEGAGSACYAGVDSQRREKALQGVPGGEPDLHATAAQTGGVGAEADVWEADGSAPTCPDKKGDKRTRRSDAYIRSPEWRARRASRPRAPVLGGRHLEPSETSPASAPDPHKGDERSDRSSDEPEEPRFGSPAFSGEFAPIPLAFRALGASLPAEPPDEDGAGVARDEGERYGPPSLALSVLTEPPTVSLGMPLACAEGREDTLSVEGAARALRVSNSPSLPSGAGLHGALRRPPDRRGRAPGRTTGTDAPLRRTLEEPPRPRAPVTPIVCPSVPCGACGQARAASNLSPEKRQAKSADEGRSTAFPDISRSAKTARDETAANSLRPRAGAPAQTPRDSSAARPRRRGQVEAGGETEARRERLRQAEKEARPGEDGETGRNDAEAETEQGRRRQTEPSAPLRGPTADSRHHEKNAGDEEASRVRVGEPVRVAEVPAFTYAPVYDTERKKETKAFASTVGHTGASPPSQVFSSGASSSKGGVEAEALRRSSAPARRWRSANSPSGSSSAASQAATSASCAAQAPLEALGSTAGKADAGKILRRDDEEHLLARSASAEGSQELPEAADGQPGRTITRGAEGSKPPAASGSGSGHAAPSASRPLAEGDEEEGRSSGDDRPTPEPSSSLPPSKSFSVPPPSPSLSSPCSPRASPSHATCSPSSSAAVASAHSLSAWAAFARQFSGPGGPSRSPPGSPSLPSFTASGASASSPASRSNLGGSLPSIDPAAHMADANSFLGAALSHDTTEALTSREQGPDRGVASAARLTEGERMRKDCEASAPDASSSVSSPASPEANGALVATSAPLSRGAACKGQGAWSWASRSGMSASAFHVPSCASAFQPSSGLSLPKAFAGASSRRSPGPPLPPSGGPSGSLRPQPAGASSEAARAPLALAKRQVHHCARVETAGRETGREPGREEADASGEAGPALTPHSGPTVVSDVREGERKEKAEARVTESRSAAQGAGCDSVADGRGAEDAERASFDAIAEDGDARKETARSREGERKREGGDSTQLETTQAAERAGASGQAGGGCTSGWLTSMSTARHCVESVDERERKETDEVYLGRETIELYLRPEEAEEFMKQVDFAGHGKINAEMFKRGILNIYNARKRLVRGLRSQGSVASTVLRMISLLLWFVCAVVMLLVIGVDMNSVIVSGAAFLSALTVALSYLYQHFITAVIFVALTNPYNIGDRIRVDGGEILTVRKIRTYTTEFDTVHGRPVIYSNSVLFSRVLTNESRAKNSVLELKLRVGIGTPHCLIKALETKMRKFVEQRPMDFVKDSFWVVVHHVQPGESIDYSLWMACVEGWGNYRRVLDLRSEVYFYLAKQLTKLGISFHLAPQPVSITNASPPPVQMRPLGRSSSPVSPSAIRYMHSPAAALRHHTSSRKTPSPQTFHALAVQAIVEGHESSSDASLSRRFPPQEHAKLWEPVGEKRNLHTAAPY